jgi:ferredoxin
MTTIQRKEPEMEVRLVIDRDLCIGYGECMAEDPEAVELADDGCARPLMARLSAERGERLCAACPTGAISLADVAGQPAA